MDARHEQSRGWRGAPWGRRLAADWDTRPATPAERPRVLRPLALSVLLGVALGVAIVQVRARDDRARLDQLLAAVDPAG